MSTAMLKEKLAQLNTIVKEQLLPPLSIAAAQAMGAFEIVSERLEVLKPLVPYLARAFHVGFIPLVIILGMRTEPRPKLVDLLTPM